MCRYGNGVDQTAKNAWATDRDIFNCSDGYAYTAPVGSFLPNAFGLYDMLGDAWQWAEDCEHYTYDGAPSDGSAWTIGDCRRRVHRGGSWSSDPRALRAADSLMIGTGYRSDDIGFRLARSLTQ